MKSWRAVALLVAVASVGVAGACGGSSSGDDGSGPGGGDGPTIDETATMYVDLACGMLTRCSGPLFDKDLLGIDCKGYLGDRVKEGVFAGLKEAIEAGTVIYHPDKVQACIDALKKYECDMFLNRGPDVCDQVYEGTVETGGACKFDEECKGKSYCKADGACPGKCAPREDEGAACAEDSNCKDGLNCSNGKCQKPVPVDGDCTAGGPECVIGALCQGGDKGKTGKCVKWEDLLKGKPGDKCDFDQGPWCATDSACVFQTGSSGMTTQCVKRASSGGACSFGIINPCPADEYCDADITKQKMDGTCKKLPGDGEKCLTGPGRFAKCAPGLKCDSSGTCRKLGHLGEACSENMLCYSGNCKDGKCVAGNACSAWENRGKGAPW